MAALASRSRFARFASATSRAAGKPITFVIAVATIVAWAAAGPVFGFSDTWQLVINTATTVITFLMVFLIQNTQNRDTAAIQVKLDELIRVTQGHNALMDLEELEEHDLEAFRAKYEKEFLDICARERRKRGHGAAPETSEPLILSR